MSLCATCHAGCCRSFAVPVTGADILRIAREQGLGFWEFVCRWADPEGAIALNHAPQFYFCDEPHTPFVIGLRHEASQHFVGTTRCQFLKEEAPTADAPLGKAHCGIYGSRPAACRAFPAKLNATGELAILYDVPERGRDGDLPAYQLCPRPWQPSDCDPLSLVQELVVAQYEMQFFHRLAAGWNESPGLWSDFPAFVQYVYAHRLRPASEADEIDRVAPAPAGVYPRIAA